jgi:hypothetical protein
MSNPSDRVDTSKARRRAVRFESAAEALADAEALCSAHKRGKLGRTGNWTLGQALHHIASWMTYPFTGFPVTPPEEVAARSRAAKPRVLGQGMMAGIVMSGVEGGTAACEDVETDAAMAELRASWERIQQETPMLPHPFFGPLTAEEWVQLQLRHSELHQGFFFVE